MRQLKPLLGVAALTLVLGAGQATAQDAGNKEKGAEARAAEKGAKGTEKGAKGARKERQAPKPGAGAQVQFKRIEDVLGKPLTDDQKKAIIDAQKVMQESVAKTLGMTLEEWQAKQKEYRAAHPPEGAKAKEGDKAKN